MVSLPWCSSKVSVEASHGGLGISLLLQLVGQAPPTACDPLAVAVGLCTDED